MLVAATLKPKYTFCLFMLHQTACTQRLEIEMACINFSALPALDNPPDLFKAPLGPSRQLSSVLTFLQKESKDLEVG